MSLWYQTPDLGLVNGWSTHTLMETLDIRITAFGDDWLSGTMPVDARTHQPYGLLHGGASVALESAGLVLVLGLVVVRLRGRRHKTL